MQAYSSSQTQFEPLTSSQCVLDHSIIQIVPSTAYESLATKARRASSSLPESLNSLAKDNICRLSSQSSSLDEVHCQEFGEKRTNSELPATDFRIKFIILCKNRSSKIVVISPVNYILFRKLYVYLEPFYEELRQSDLSRANLQVSRS